MQQFSSKLKSRLQAEEGGALFSGWLVAFLLLLLFLGVGIDSAKNVTLKEAQDAQAQQAVQVAVKQVDERGSLGSIPASATIPSSITKAGAAYLKSYRGDASTATFKTDYCNTRTITTWNGAQAKVQLPYMVFRLDTQRAMKNTGNAVTFVVDSDGKAQQVAGTLRPNLKYQVIQGEVHDSTSNFFLGMVGMPCQDLTSRVSAVAFGSQGDLR